MTVEQVLRRIERECREDMAALEGYEPHWRMDGTGTIMKGARSEARGVVDKCREIRLLCRKMRREHRISNAGAVPRRGRYVGTSPLLGLSGSGGGE